MALSITFSFDEELVMSMQSYSDGELKYVTITFSPANSPPTLDDENNNLNS